MQPLVSGVASLAPVRHYAQQSSSQGVASPSTSGKSGVQTELSKVCTGESYFVSIRAEHGILSKANFLDKVNLGTCILCTTDQGRVLGTPWDGTVSTPDKRQIAKNYTVHSPGLQGCQ